MIEDRMMTIDISTILVLSSLDSSDHLSSCKSDMPFYIFLSYWNGVNQRNNCLTYYSQNILLITILKKKYSTIKVLGWNWLKCAARVIKFMCNSAQGRMKWNAAIRYHKRQMIVWSSLDDQETLINIQSPIS